MVLDLPTPELWKAELTRLPGNAPAGSRTRDLSITSPTPYHYSTEPQISECLCWSWSKLSTGYVWFPKERLRRRLNVAYEFVGCWNFLRTYFIPIGVGAQSTLGGKTFLPKNVWKNNDICPKNETKFPKFIWYLPENVRILRDICPKNIFPEIGGVFIPIHDSWPNNLIRLTFSRILKSPVMQVFLIVGAGIYFVPIRAIFIGCICVSCRVWREERTTSGRQENKDGSDIGWSSQSARTVSEWN